MHNTNMKKPLSDIEVPKQTRHIVSWSPEVLESISVDVYDFVSFSLVWFWIRLMLNFFVFQEDDILREQIRNHGTDK